MSVTLSVTIRTIERHISIMKKLGILKRDGKSNKGQWVITYKTNNENK